MKKVLAMCLAVVMLVCMSVTAMAAPNNFVSSPSGTPGSGVVTFDPGDDDCTASLIFTPYIDREDLPEALRELFEKAYNELINAGNLAELVEGLKDIVARLGIDGEDLVVGDFFFLHTTGCDTHGEHNNCTVTLDADALNHFVGLLFMNEEGKWELVENAQVVSNGQNLQFTMSGYGPYAVVVDASAGSLIAPQTGDYGVVGTVAVLLVLSAATLGFVVLKRKKTEA